MLIPTTPNAIATLLIAGPSSKQNDNYFNMTIGLARSIREIGYDEDIVVITNHQPYEEPLVKEGLLVERREVFDYPALHDYKCRAWELSIFDIQKVYYWSLWQYHRVICLDCDVLAKGIKFTDWHMTGVLVQKNRAPVGINSGIMLITPSAETYNMMRQLLKNAKFSPESGWNECGLIEGIHKWDFQNVNAAQGFIPFFFDWKHTLYPCWGKYFHHFAGKAKFQEEYLTQLRRYGLSVNTK
jgi:hypothetical protein